MLQQTVSLCLALLPAVVTVGLAAEPADESFGCEANPTGNPIGGGPGYTPIFTKGDFTVRTKDELLAVLKQAQRGQVVFVPDGVEIDLTGCRDLRLPAGVTLAGTRGLNGSPGARLFTTWRQSHALMETAGYDVRLTGLRFEGAYGGTEKVADHSHFLSVCHSGGEVDNCEVRNFNVVGIGVAAEAIGVRIHHNYIHHCQRSGYGYGVSTNSSDCRVIANRFDACRHHIASGGTPGAGYEAAWNLIGPEATASNFDVHGGRDRGDGTDIAGDWLAVHHNTFQFDGWAVGIRGVPSQGAQIHHNWFTRPAAKAVFAQENTRVFMNVHGPDKTLEK